MQQYHNKATADAKFELGNLSSKSVKWVIRNTPGVVYISASAPEEKFTSAIISDSAALITFGRRMSTEIKHIKHTLLHTYTNSALE